MSRRRPLQSIRPRENRKCPVFRPPLLSVEVQALRLPVSPLQAPSPIRRLRNLQAFLANYLYVCWLCNEKTVHFGFKTGGDGSGMIRLIGFVSDSVNCRTWSELVCIRALLA